MVEKKKKAMPCKLVWRPDPQQISSYMAGKIQRKIEEAPMFGEKPKNVKENMPRKETEERIFF